MFFFQFRPKHNPLSWPLAPPAKDPSGDASAAAPAAAAAAKKDGGALNPNVPEFVPSFGGGGGGGGGTTAAAALNPGMTPFSAVSLQFARNMMDKG